MKNNCGIYAIIVNGLKIYIGQSKRIEDEMIGGRKVRGRFSSHLKDFKYNRHGTNKRNKKTDHLQHAWNKYGETAFEFKVLEYCKLEELNEREQYYINYYNSTNSNCGYNKALIAGKPPHTEDSKKQTIEKRKGKPSWNKGIPCREETKKKLSIANTGKKGVKVSQEHKDKLKKIHTGMKHSEESKKKMSESLKGRKAWNKGIKTGIIPWNKGLPMPDEAKEKCRQANLGNSYRKGKKANKPAWNKGKKWNDEAREKMSQSHKGITTWNKGIKATEEHREKLRIAHTGKKIPKETIEKATLGRRKTYLKKQIIKLAFQEIDNRHKLGGNTTSKY